MAQTATWCLVDLGPRKSPRDAPCVVAPRVGRADRFLPRLRGLLGRRSLADDEGLWIEPCDSIHTFFMRFPIDVAFVDKGGTVLRRLDALPPWRATRLHAKARACVELAAGTLARHGVVAGTRLALLPASGASGGVGGGSLPATGSPGGPALV